MPNPTVSRSSSGISVSVPASITPAQATELARQLTAAAAPPVFGPIPGTFTVTAPVSSKRGNNVLHGVTSIYISSNSRVECYAGNSQPKYADGSQHTDFSKQVRATKGPDRGQMKFMSVKYVPTA